MTQARIDRMKAELQAIDHGKLLVLAVAAAVVVLLATVTGMTSPELTAGETAASPPATSDVSYFPGQHSNQATEPSEHIQAF